MNRHTPGPWWCAGDMPGEEPTMYPVVRAFVDATQRIAICRVGHMNNYSFDRDHRDFHNARLIAAAPDLFQALELMTDLVSTLESIGIVGDNALHIINLARAAIKKATKNF